MISPACTDEVDAVEHLDVVVARRGARRITSTASPVGVASARVAGRRAPHPRRRARGVAARSSAAIAASSSCDDRRDRPTRDAERGGALGLALHAPRVVLRRGDRDDAVGVARELHRAEAEQDGRDLGGRGAVPADRNDGRYEMWNPELRTHRRRGRDDAGPDHGRRPADAEQDDRREPEQARRHDRDRRGW